MHVAAGALILALVEFPTLWFVALILVTAAGSAWLLRRVEAAAIQTRSPGEGDPSARSAGARLERGVPGAVCDVAMVPAALARG